jgi:predicted RNA polymerase sigma factor
VVGCTLSLGVPGRSQPDRELAPRSAHAREPAFRVAFREAFAALDAPERTVLKLSFLAGLSVRKLAPVFGVSPATANRRVLDAQHRPGELVLVRLGARVQADPDELASVVRGLLSRLDVSLSTLVREG